MNEQVYISDTNIWIDLQNAGLLDKLFNLPFLISCTDFVLNELTGFDHQHLIDMGLVIEALDEQATASLIGLMRSHNNSSVADVSCFQLASETGRPLLTGDRRLRIQAQSNGLQVHGVLWLLDQMLAHQVITAHEAGVGLQNMLACGARLPAEEVRRRLALWSS